MGGPYSSGKVHFPACDIPPEPLAGFKKAFILRKPGNIRHAGIKVHCPHCMAYRLFLFPYRQVRLVIVVPEHVGMFPGLLRILLVKIVGLFSSFLNKKPGKGQIPFLPGGFIKAHQCHFRNLMSRIALAFPFPWPEITVNVIGKFSGGI